MFKRNAISFQKSAWLAIIIIAVSIPFIHAADVVQQNSSSAPDEIIIQINDSDSGIASPSATIVPVDEEGIPIPPKGTGAATMPPEFAPPSNAMQGGAAMPYPSGSGTYPGGNGPYPSGMQNPAGMPGGQYPVGTTPKNEILPGIDENTVLFGALGLGVLMLIAFFLVRMKKNKEDEVVDEYREKYGKSL